MTVACALIVAALSSDGIGRHVRPPEWMPTNAASAYIAYGTWKDGERKGTEYARLTAEGAAAVCSLLDGFMERDYARCGTDDDTAYRHFNLSRTLDGSWSNLCWYTTRRFAYEPVLEKIARYVKDGRDWAVDPMSSQWLHDNYRSYASGGYGGSWSTVVEGTNAIEFTETDLADLFKWPSYGMSDYRWYTNSVQRKFFTDRWEMLGAGAKGAADKLFSDRWLANQWETVSNAHRRAGVILEDADRARTDRDAVAADLGTNEWEKCFARVESMETNATLRIDWRALGWMNHLCSQLDSWYASGISPGSYSNTWARAECIRYYEADIEIPFEETEVCVTPQWHYTSNVITTSKTANGTPCPGPYACLSETTAMFSYPGGPSYDTPKVDILLDKGGLVESIRLWLSPILEGMSSTNYILKLSIAPSSYPHQNPTVQVTSEEVGIGEDPVSFTPDPYFDGYRMCHECSADEHPNVKARATLVTTCDASWSEPTRTGGAVATNEAWANAWAWTNGYVRAMDVWGFETMTVSSNWWSAPSYSPSWAWNDIADWRKDHAAARLWKYTAESLQELAEGERQCHENLFDDVRMDVGIGGGDTLESLVQRVRDAGDWQRPTNEVTVVSNGLSIPRYYDAPMICVKLTISENHAGYKTFDLDNGYWSNFEDDLDWVYLTSWPKVVGWVTGGIKEGYSDSWTVHPSKAAGAQRRVIVEATGKWHNMKRD